MSSATSSVMWFRRDLRVRDNPALLAALEDGTATALFVVDPALWSRAGAARRAWLAANVLALAERIPLTIRHGDPREVVPRVADGRRVHVSAETTPHGRRRDEAVGQRVELVATGSPYAVGPGRVRNGSGNPYQVFTAFARGWREHGWPEPA
ncbi:MAG: deoxyribodipyrimidine photo-lyase, partial [Marmoricola sp.]